MTERIGGYNLENASRSVGLREFCVAGLQIAQLRRREKDDISTAGLVALAGLMAGFPERVNMTTMQNSAELRLFTEVISMGTDINDYVDMGARLREVRNEDDVAEMWYRKILNDWRGSLRSIGFRDLIEGDKETIKSYMLGVLKINGEMRKERNWDFEKIERYKKLENGLSMVCTAALVLKDEEMDGVRLDLNCRQRLDDVEGKMSWLLDNEPRNETERRLCALFAVVMMTQFIDDWTDLEIDRDLGLYTLATGLLDKTEGDTVKAKR
jgi:hypothetical protein